LARTGLIRSRPLLAAILFQAALIPLALALAALAGLDPRRALQPTPEIVLGGLLATVPLVAALLLLGRRRPGWFDDVERLVRPLIGMLFRGRGAGPVVLVAALAGLGEELLFRGVLQVWLADGFGGSAGLLLASVIFGMAHALSRAYFLLATAMGLYLGGLFALTGSLLLPVIVHAVYDAVAIALLLRPPQGGREEAPDRVP
jgi:membrane protease YdiL (CAAX protease family)